ncbi:unnamed protein product [Lepeophtheirus salmonis]|uniref:(salmon louse) hypothetical protein n=1 Tax=Lepeophtheirus salmonis TaxID=72036 RepID=A0A7R8CUH5_LEPSM|nr:unnamed protein product [Lepeophtheirus salmonis]CAF2936324.1 unnamed protein product [Lepeophtheirus salmonis]
MALFGFGGIEGFVRKSSSLHSPKHLEVSLEFRTSRSNGVLFAFKLRKKGENQKYIIIYLNDDVLNCALLGLTSGALNLQKSLQETKTPLRWNNVGMKYSIESAAHILELFFDPLHPSPKQFILEGLPKQLKKISPKLYSPFVGCLKEIFVNSNMDSFRYNRKSAKPLLPCFQQVGSGNYFVTNGSHAVYDFPTVSPSPSVYLTISLEFKTPSVLDQRLFSILQLETGTPGVTASLLNGKFEVKLGSEQLHGSKFICPNVWHKIEISVNNDKRVKLIVDGVTDSSSDTDQVLSYNFTEIIFGMLSGELSYMGCLRNVFINGKNMESMKLITSKGVVEDGCSI